MAGLFGHLSIPIVKRRVFFSFHYQYDIWRVNQVRNSWRYQHEESREAEGFFDGSIWESSRRTGPESLKNLIREGIKNTSVTCVLIGTETFSRRWVRYEIARSVIKGNGLLAVKIHRLKNQRGYVSIEGQNPLDYMGVYQSGGNTRLAEHKNGQWIAFNDYTQSVHLPDNWLKPQSNHVIPLSRYAEERCYVLNVGSANFSSWVRVAAQNAGR